MKGVKNNYYVCPKCSGYLRVHVYRRIGMLADEGASEEWSKEIPLSNPPNLPGYEERVLTAREKDRLSEAIITDKCKVDESPAVVGVCDARSIMSSMGHVAGEKIIDTIERATREKIPVILFVYSGGTGMQEGIVSLMQVAKTSAALECHHEAGQLSISVLTNPTAEDVTAGPVMLGDIILIELHALVGFVGPRVIEQTIGQRLPEGFQRSEFLLEHGFADKIVERKDQKRIIGQILYMHRSHRTNMESRSSVETARTFADEPSESQEDDGKTAQDMAFLSRESDRPVATDYINALLGKFIEPHGSRYSRGDRAIVDGVVMFHGISVTIIGRQKGENIKDNITRNPGMPSPDGYRKALRLMRQTEIFRRPVVCFVDTLGALCGLGAEEREQGGVIARSLFEISDLKVPVLSIIIGGGGSGDALTMAVADEVWMLENTTYSILSPEGFASILYKDNKKAPDAVKVIKVTARDLLQLKLIERIMPEEQPTRMDNLYRFTECTDSAMAESSRTYLAMSDEELREYRYQRLRRM